MKILCLLLCLSFAAQAQQNLDLYLLIGQSNMAGRGRADGYLLPADSLWMQDKKGSWVPAKEPFHYDKPAAGTGLAGSFATLMLKENKRPIGLIPAAVGGTAIRYWKPAAQDPATGLFPYDDVVARARTAMQSGKLKAILWHQGESDTERTEEYIEAFTTLMKNLHKDLGIPLGSIPVLIGETGEFGDKIESRKRINTVLNSIPQRLPYVLMVHSTGLTHTGDYTHFDSAALRILGERYARALLSARH